MPPLQLTDDAVKVLRNYYWPGNIRQLKNITEQISIIEREKEIGADELNKYLPDARNSGLPVLYHKTDEESFSERELLYKVLFDMKRDMAELKKIVLNLIEKDGHHPDVEQTKALLVKDFGKDLLAQEKKIIDQMEISHREDTDMEDSEDYDHTEIIEESLSLTEKEHEMIKRALEKHHGKRKNAANELGISERTLYRKIKEYNIK